MTSSSTVDVESCWKLLGKEMARECERMNHHFRCPAGEARFYWSLKHTMIASVNDFPRLVITKGAAQGGALKLACFAEHFYAHIKLHPRNTCWQSMDRWIAV